MLLSWQHSGFHVHAGEPVLPDDTDRLDLDVFEMIRRLCAQIPAPRQHLVRYYGWYSHRARGVRGEGSTTETSPSPPTPRSRIWARPLRKILEVDPLLCPQCGVEMRLLAVIQAPTVIDGILAHLQRIGGNDPHEGTAQRGPPAG